MRLTALSLLLSTAALLAGCSEYDLTAPPEEQQPPLEEEEPPPVDDDPEVLQNPIAICSSSPTEVRPPFETNTFLGRDSYDPEGIGIADYQWTLVTAPQGSSVSLQGGGADRTFTADQAGLYQAQLVVSTTDGRTSEPCTADLNAIPAEALWVEMYWEHAEDIDLHLIAPGGSLESNTDCYFMNCTSGGLEWGVAGAADNPSLDIDDTTGTGPENINIGSPQFGTFKVVVHDHPFTSYQGANNVTVNIYVDGVLAWTGTKSFSGEDTYQDFAEIDWPTAQIRGL